MIVKMVTILIMLNYVNFVTINVKNVKVLQPIVLIVNFKEDIYPNQVVLVKMECLPQVLLDQIHLNVLFAQIDVKLVPQAWITVLLVELLDPELQNVDVTKDIMKMMNKTVPSVFQNVPLVLMD